jgi:hypothetical protein
MRRLAFIELQVISFTMIAWKVGQFGKLVITHIFVAPQFAAFGPERAVDISRW